MKIWEWPIWEIPPNLLSLARELHLLWNVDPRGPGPGDPIFVWVTGKEICPSKQTLLFHQNVKLPHPHIFVQQRIGWDSWFHHECTILRQRIKGWNCLNLNSYKWTNIYGCVCVIVQSHSLDTGPKWRKMGFILFNNTMWCIYSAIAYFSMKFMSSKDAQEWKSAERKLLPKIVTCQDGVIVKIRNVI